MARSILIIIICFFSTPFGAIASCKVPIAVITFIDVGEGDASLIQSGGESLLIDTGNLISGNSVLTSLKALGVAKVDRIILTHPHPDHMGGVFQVAQQIPFHSIHDNGENLDSPPDDAIRWYRDFVQKHERYIPISQGDSFILGKGHFKILWPPRALPGSDWNTNSLVILSDFKGYRVLFMGDGNLATESSLIRSGVDIKANLLKVGHHGAEDASSEAFIKRVAPQVSILSVNDRNIREYPSSRVLKRLKKYSSVYSTSKSGSITLTLCNENEYEVTTER